MENAEEILQILERFTKLKQKDIPKELDEYLAYVAKTGDTVFSWANIKYLFREKLIHVIKDFHDSTSNIDDLPQYPNVDPFNYETMKTALLERLELFNSAPFTIQRICELLTNPKKQYSRIDKFMRALEKNILVVSTIEPGRKQAESENGDSSDSIIALEVVDFDMEDEIMFNAENQKKQNGSNGTTSTTNNKFEAENNKTHDDVELPSAKKPKLDITEEESAKNEANKNDKNDEKTERNNITDKENDLKKEEIESNDKGKSDCENNKHEDHDEHEENEVNSVEKESEKSSSSDAESTEKVVEEENKKEKLEEKQEDSVTENEKNGNDIDKDNIDDVKSPTTETTKTEEEPTEEEEDKLLNVNDEVTSEDTSENHKIAQDEDVSIKTKENSVEEEKEDVVKEKTDEIKETEENHSTKTVETTVEDKTDSKIKVPEEASQKEELQKEEEKEEEKKIELFSTDDVVDPSEQPKKDTEQSETKVSETKIDVDEEPDLKKSSNNVTEEKCEEKPSESDITKTKTVESESSVAKEDKEEKPTEKMAIEEPAVVSETTTKTVEEKDTEKIPATEVLSSEVTNNISEPISEDIESPAEAESQAPVDQPMEDPSISDNPVDIETATADTTPCVEMQPADSNEMATDDVPPAKIDEKQEVAGMDVDDVSQGEAMDQ